MSKYILGGGVAGLVAAYYNPDYSLITDKLGGWQNLNKFKLGPRVIEVTPKTEKFIQSLGFSVGTRKVRIGYLEGSEPLSTFSDSFRSQYAMKTRDLTEEYHSTILSGGKNELTVFDLDYDDVLKKLESWATSILLEKIKTINLDQKAIYTQRLFINYSSVINTLPYSLFLKLVGKKDSVRDFTTFNTLFAKVSYDSFPQFVEWKNDFDYIYCLSEPYHRINFFNDHAVLEFKDRSLVPSDIEILDLVVIPSAQMKFSYTDIRNPFENVECVGRYAEWNHKIKLEQLVERYEIIRS